MRFLRGPCQLPTVWVAAVCLLFVAHCADTATIVERLRNTIFPTTNHPIIFVPGDGGSQVQAKLNKTYAVHYLCEKKTLDFFDLWVNLELMVPYVLDCWVDNMRLVYNNVTRTTTPPPGVEIRIPGFGNTSTVEWLDPSMVSPTAYFTKIVEEFVSLGYQRGVNLRGAPYDFRKAPNELGDYFDKLQGLVEETYEINGAVPVVLVCHSMGCPNLRYFLSQRPQAWKDTRIRALITLGGAWGGAVKALKAYASGENLGVVVINPLTVRPEQRSAPSLAYMMPDRLFWNSSEVLVSTLTANYTIADYYRFFKDIGFLDGYDMYKDTRPYMLDTTPPGVEVHCLHGRNVSTIERIEYHNKGFPDIQPVVVYGDGDGTVNLRSLQGCLKFRGLQKEKVFVKPLDNVEHMAILYERASIDYIKAIALGH
ncbi:phospholipase A2 group XV [Ixodes scapularis]|uniref:phospholipase A2 group XV n=1 Tax=Ixodes scapularis TaxID=6945 RepID=UPI001A9E5D05|nr:phospholipase A2 group XV [Ixodes scapularis]